MIHDYLSQTYIASMQTRLVKGLANHTSISLYNFYSLRVLSIWGLAWTYPRIHGNIGFHSIYSGRLAMHLPQ